MQFCEPNCLVNVERDEWLYVVVLETYSSALGNELIEFYEYIAHFSIQEFC